MDRTRTLTLAALLLAGLLAFPSPAQAGTPEDPEITDPDNDSTGDDAGQDIVRAWIEAPEDPGTALYVYVETAADFEHPPSYYARHIRYSVRFGVSNPDGLGGAAEAYVDMRPTRQADTAPNVYLGPDELECRFGKPAEAGGSQDLTEEKLLTAIFDDSVGNRFGCILPFGELGSFGPGESVTELRVLLQEVSRGPTTGGDEIPVTVHATHDRAPDDGFGRDFTVPAAPVPQDLPPTWETLTGNATSLGDTFAFANGTNAVRHYNWTTVASNVTVGYDAVVEAGSVAFEVRDGFDLVVVQGTLTGNLSDSRAYETGPGNWSIAVEYDNFTGAFRLDLSTPDSVTTDPGPGGNGTGDGGDGNQTEDGGGGKDSPGPALPAVGLAVLGVALAVRRRLRR